VSADGIGIVEGLGFPAIAAGMTVAERSERVAPALPEIMALPPAQRRGPLFAGFFARAAAPRMRRDLAPIVDDLRPDLIVHETAELAAAPIATARAIPHVTVAFSGAVPPAAVPTVLEAVRPVWQAEGVVLEGYASLAGDCYFHPFPPSFGGAPPLDVVAPLRPMSAASEGPPPGWLATFAVDRPGVYLTAGTERAASTAPWAAAVEAIASLDVDAVATLGPHVDPLILGPIPHNLRVERFVPQAFLLGRVGVVVSHGGAGTLLGTAAAGVPQVVTPVFADQWENGAAVEASGAGLLLPAERRTAPDLRAAIERALGDPGIIAAAARVAGEIAAMPDARHYVPMLEQLGRR
jgi:hypothetical protein